MTSRDIPSTQRSSVDRNEKSLNILDYSLGQNLKNGIWPRSFPLWMAGFYISLFIIRPWEQLVPWLGVIHFERIYAVCMILAVLITQKKQIRVSSMTFAVLYFYFVMVMSGIFSWNPSLAWTPIYAYTVLVIFYFVLVSIIITEYDLIFIVICYILSMVIYLAKAQWEFFVNNKHVYRMGVDRLVGLESTYGGPNGVALSIVASLPILLFLWIYRKEVSSGWPKVWQKRFSQGLIMYAYLAISSIVLTNSRSGMLTFILFVLLSLSIGKNMGRIIKSAILGVIILGIVWQVMPEDNKNRFRTLWDPSVGPKNAQTSAEGRIAGLKAGIEMFKQRPILGCGVGNFKAYRIRFVDGDGHRSHNLIGQILGTTGVLGALAFILLITLTLVNCRKVKLLAKGRDDPYLNVFYGLTYAVRNSLILLLFDGMAGHNLFRYNWLWLAAFSTLSLEYAVRRSEVLK